jgi:CDGSH-type Zn-finger protein
VESKAKKASVKIRVIKNGPFLVEGPIALRRQTIKSNAAGQALEWTDGESVPTPANYSLCRCGKTKRAPFCDGTHSEIGFDGTETAGNEPYIEDVELIEGPKLILTDKRALCASARFCDSYGGTWKLTTKSDDPRAREIAIRQTGDCPAGRLVVYDKETFEPIEPKLEREIVLVEDPVADCSGPLWVKSGIPVISGNGEEYEIRNRVTLCRCGKSTNMPFCDGSHVRHGFKEKNGKYDVKG